MRWVREIFAPTLQDCLEPQLGKGAEVYDDKRLHDGPNFDAQLYERLGESAILVPVLTASYFDSEWCRREFAIMREREKNHGIREGDDTRTLIVPVYLCGSPKFPTCVKNMQASRERDGGKCFWDYFNPHLAPGTQRRAEFHDLVREWSNEIVTALDNAPEQKSAFASLRGGTFIDELRPPDLTPPVPSMIPPAHSAT
jgi:hypothetical protein